MSEAEPAENAGPGSRFGAETRGAEPDAERGHGSEHGIDRPKSAPIRRPAAAANVAVRPPVVVLRRGDEIVPRTGAQQWGIAAGFL